MAKIKNDDYIRDALDIIDKLSKIENLNESSKALSRGAKTHADLGDGRFAFTLAHSADYMHTFCTEVLKHDK